MTVSEKLFDCVSHLSNDDLIKLSTQISKEHHKRKSREIQEWVDKVNDLLLKCPVDIISGVERYEVINAAYYNEDEEVIKIE